MYQTTNYIFLQKFMVFEIAFVTLYVGCLACFQHCTINELSMKQSLGLSCGLLYDENVILSSVHQIDLHAALPGAIC